MRERVAMLDGDMTAGATGEGGYEIAAFIPVQAGSEPREQQAGSEPREQADRA
jgi:hypothetical protein